MAYCVKAFQKLMVKYRPVKLAFPVTRMTRTQYKSPLYYYDHVWSYTVENVSTEYPIKEPIAIEGMHIPLGATIKNYIFKPF